MYPKTENLRFKLSLGLELFLLPGTCGTICYGVDVLTRVSVKGPGLCPTQVQKKGFKSVKTINPVF